jgi:chemotaxis protein MotB
MARKKSEDAAPAGCPAWLATYGDMVTLILTFFVLLFAMSEVDKEKWVQVVAAFTGNVSVMEGGNQVLPDGPWSFEAIEPAGAEDSKEEEESQAQQDPQVKEAMDQAEAALQKMLQDAQQAEDAANQNDQNDADANNADNSQSGESDAGDTGESGWGNALIQRGQYEITVRLPGDLLFDSGRAEIKEETLPSLDALVAILNAEIGGMEMLRIEGHADNMPISTPQYPNNRILAYDRAYHVYEFLREQMPDVEDRKYSLASFGESRPLEGADNATAEGRAQNRRVDLVLVWPYAPVVRDLDTSGDYPGI